MARTRWTIAWTLAALLVPALCLGREAVVEFNTRGVAPNIDVQWQVKVVGDFVDLTAQETGLVLTAASGNFGIQQVRLNPIGGADRPSITLGAEAPYWTSRFDGFGVVYEITVRQPLTRNGHPVTVNVPIAVRLLEERIEERPVVAEFRNLRVQGSPESQNVDYTFNVALMGTYCPNDVTFFVRSDALRSVSGSTDSGGELKPVRETLPAGTTTVIKDVRVSLFGPRPLDRQGTYRMALVGRDTKGNLVVTQCEVPLRPPWVNSQAAGAPPAGAN